MNPLKTRIFRIFCATSVGLAAWTSVAQPANDNFADAEVLQVTNTFGSISTDTTGATAEPNEPSHAGSVPFSTVWYEWTAPQDGEVTFDTTGSLYNTMLAVYRGETIEGLAQVAANNGAWKGGNAWYSDLLLYDYFTSGSVSDLFFLSDSDFLTAGPSMVRFNAKAGETYYIAVSGTPTYIRDEEGFITVIYDGPMTLSWAYKSAGVFHFTSSYFQASEDESMRRWSGGGAMHESSTARHEQRGMLVTITRSMGSSGRVVVDYVLEDGTTLDNSVGPALLYRDYLLEGGSVIFNEYEMSRTILVPIYRSIPEVLEVAENEEGEAMVREFKIRIENVRLDDGESEDILPPRKAARDTEVPCYILDGDVDPVMARNYVQTKAEGDEEPPPPVFTSPTNVVVNIGRRYFRVREDEPAGFLCVPLVRGGTNQASVTIHYIINYTGNYANSHADNAFSLTPGADYATPNPENAGAIGRGPDYEPITGTITLPANTPGVHIDIPILDDNRPEFNEDLLLSIWAERDGRPYHLGQIFEANITILHDPNDPPAGSVDIQYNQDYYHASEPANMPHPGADSTVFGLVMEPDDRTVIVGDFTTYNNTPRGRVARIQANGALDWSFNPGAGANDFIASIDRAEDGKYIIGGAFSFFNGVQCNGIARLNSDGSLDTSFNTGLGANGTIWAIKLQSDGKILIGGDFDTFNKIACRGLARLNADGTLDASFNPGTFAPNGVVNAIAIMPNGQIVVGGEFSAPGFPGLENLMAFATNGLPASAFNGALGLGPAGPVYALTPHQGKLVVAGEFTSFGIFERGRIARLNANGSIDLSFDTRVGADDTIHSVVVSPTGGLYIGGLFAAFNGTHRLGFARLYADGTVDTTFLDTAYNHFAGLPRAFNNSAISPKGFVWASGVASDGGVIIAGGFSQVGGGYSDINIQPPDMDTFGLGAYFERLNRAAIRNRHNIARLVGGETPGPGNLGLLYESYSVNELQTSLYVSLVRENGGLGYANANFSILPATAAGGADFIYHAVPSTYRGSWSGIMADEWQARPYTRMKSDGYLGTNSAVVDIYGQPWPPEPWLAPDPAWQCIVGIPNPATAGSRHASFELSIPSGADHWYPGGENIPIGTALGRSSSQFEIIGDDRNAGRVGFALMSYVVSEGTNAVITVERTDGSAGAVSIRFATVPGGTAMPGVDYYSTNGTLSFQAGQTTKSFVVRLIPNGIVQPADRTIKIRLSDPSGVPLPPLLGATESVITIIDDDFPNGYVKFSQPTFSTNEDAGAVVLTLTRTGGSTGSLRVYYQTKDGTAIGGLNYRGVTNFVQWAHLDVTPKPITIPFIPNDVVGGNVYFTNLLGPAVVNTQTNNMVLSGASPATIEIVEDDSYGLAEFSSAEYYVSERGGTAAITVVRKQGIAQSLSVTYRTVAGTATDTGIAPNYQAASGQLLFLPGEVAKTFQVQILPDGFQNSFPEGFYFTVNLENTVPVGQLGSITTTRVNIIDAESFNYPPGDLDLTFDPTPGFNGEVFTLDLQADGKVLVGGDFTTANAAQRSRIARILPGGGLDPTFQAGLTGANGPVRTLLVQSDGRVVIGGAFTQVNGVPYNRLARLIGDGNVDTSFNLGTGADGMIHALAETFQGTNRTLLVGGAFNSVNGQLRHNLVRLNNSGALDPSFNPGLVLDGAVYAIAVCPTNSIHGGKIIIGGAFTNVNGISRAGIARLNPDGSLDASFDPGVGASDAVRAIALQLDGRILVGGAFTNFQGQAMNRLARLAPNGLLDASFNAGQGANDTVEVIKVLPDNRILVAGQFTAASGVTRGRISRLLPGGQVDPSINFNEGANAVVHSVAVQSDGRMILGGNFTEYAGYPRKGLARIFGGAISGSGSFEFATAEFQALEGATNAWVGIRRRGGSANAVTVQIATTPGTAVPGVNYLNTNASVVFPEGEVFKTVQIPLLHDIQITPDLTVWLDITSVSAGEIGNQPYATLTILNTDSTVKFASETFFRSEAAVDGTAAIQIVREGSLHLGASVDFITTTNGTAIPELHYSPVSNTVFFAKGQQTASVKVPVLRDPLAQGNRTVSMILTNGAGVFLSDPSAATLVIQDADQAPGHVFFALTNLFVSEGAGVLEVAVVRTNGSSGVISVDYATTGGTALPGIVYQPVSGRLTFLDSETVKTFQVPLFNNSQVQGNSTFYLELSNPLGGTAILDPSIVPVTVLDDDAGVRFSTPAYTTIDEEGTVALTVVRQNATNGITTVQYATTNVTAFAGTNYTATSGTLTFAPGELIKNFNVPIKRDPRVTGALSFGVNLFNPSAPSQLLVPAAAVVVIVDADPGVGFTNNVFGTLKSATNALITVLRTNETPDTVTVNYYTTNGTAVAGVDYIATSGTLTFLNGAESASFTVPIIRQRVADFDKSFEVVLANPSTGVQVLPPGRATVIITNDLAGLSFSSPTYTVKENGVSATIEVVRSTYTNSLVTVDYAATDGSATGGLHYVQTQGTFIFAPGEVRKSFTVTVLDNTVVDVDHTILLSLQNPSTNAVLVSPAATLTILEDDGSFVIPAGAALVSESGPVNNTIDPGETVQVWLALRNVSGTNTQNLVATLLPGPGVSNPSGPQNYGVLEVKGPSAYRPFSFTANGTNGQPIALTLSLVDGSSMASNAVFHLGIGNVVAGYTNSAMITINDAAPANPYPSTINVSGLGGAVSKVSVTLSNFTHNWPSDVSMVLVSPSGARSYLMSKAGGSFWVTNATVTFEDSAAAPLPPAARITTGTYKPTSYSVTTPSFPAPALPGPYATNLSVFNGQNPNGTWSLYVMDGPPLYAGAISNGWSLRLSTGMSVSADLGLTMEAAEPTAILTSNVTFTVTARNHGPSPAANVVVTDVLPAGARFVEAVPSQGSVATNAMGQVIWSVGSMPVNSAAQLSLVVSAHTAGRITNSATISSSTSDLNADDNFASAETLILTPDADLNIAIVGSGNPVPVGLDVIYTVTVHNAGPAAAPGVVATYSLPPGVQFISAAPGHSFQNGKVSLNLGLVDVGGQASGTITVRPMQTGITDNYVTCASAVIDPLKDDNEAMIKTTVVSLGLKIEVDGSDVVISWDAMFNVQGFRSAPSLHAAEWTDVPGLSPQTAAGRTSIRIPMNGPEMYYQPKL